MREINNLDAEESIARRRLVFNEGWSDKSNRLAVYIFFSPFIFMPILLFFKEKFSPNDEFIIWTFPVSIIFGLYVLYRNATEKRLIKINTGHDRHAIKKLLLWYAKQKGYEIYRKSNNCVILNDAYNDAATRYKSTMIFFFKDQLLLFAVIRDGYKLNMPTLLTHLFLKYDLARLNKAAL